MNKQFSLILATLFALMVAVFAVLNVEPVEVNYFFGTSKWPLILVILGSVASGMIIMGAVGAARIISLKREVKHVRREKEELEVQNHLAEPDDDVGMNPKYN